uniref:Uncharacterized protein n=1 Tax=Poecilia mexicana TaxID=48701 RepID=A0A3B3WGA2_9TELE
MSPPRLTGALRSFSNVSKREDPTEQLYDLKAKRIKRQELFAREGLTWQKIVHFCSEHQDKAKQQAASEELKTLIQAAKEIVIKKIKATSGIEQPSQLSTALDLWRLRELRRRRLPATADALTQFPHPSAS